MTEIRRALPRKRRRSRKLWDLNGLLQVGTIVVLASTLIIAQRAEELPEFIDGTTIVLAALFSVELIALLQIERRRRDPFLVILVMTVLFFYAARIATLILVPESSVYAAMERIRLPNAQEMNFALLFIWFAVWAIAAGLLVIRSSPALRGSSANQRVLFGMNPILLSATFGATMAVGMCFTYLLPLQRTNVDVLDRLQSYLTILIQPEVLLITAMAFAFAGAPSLVRRYRPLIAVLLVIFFVTRLLSGGRAGVLSIVLAFFFAALAAHNRVRIRRSVAVAVTLLAIPAAVGAYAFANIWRSIYDAEGPGLASLPSEIQSYARSFPDRVRLTGTQIAGRIGFLDMAANLMAHPVEYRRIINPVYYVESIIDTGLTPGFDVFGVVRASEGLRTVYTHMTMADVRNQYHSDQFTVFAEYYLLFGYGGGLLLLFFSAVGFKLLYATLRFPEADTDTVAKALILDLFFNFWLNSFGLDWLLIGGGRLVVSAVVYMVFLRLGRRRLEAIAPEALTAA